MGIPLTKADLKRRLRPGLKLRCIENARGPCDLARVVARVKGNEIDMLGLDGKISTLNIGRDWEAEEIDGGFVVKNRNFVGRIVYLMDEK